MRARSRDVVKNAGWSVADPGLRSVERALLPRVELTCFLAAMEGVGKSRAGSRHQER